MRRAANLLLDNLYSTTTDKNTTFSAQMIEALRLSNILQRIFEIRQPQIFLDMICLKLGISRSEKVEISVSVRQ